MKDEYKYFGIYRITNKVNGKSYIGKTGVNFGDRWDCHRAQLNGGYHDNKYLQNAWNKYGSDNFEFVIIEIVDDASMLNDLEMKYISEYRRMGMSYNLHDGGDGGYNLGKHLSDETKRKIGDKNRINSLGRKVSEETRNKMSRSQSARYDKWTEEDRVRWGEMTSKCASGYKWSDESRKRFSQKQKAHPNGARFTADDIRSIRAKRESGMRVSDIAAEYNTSVSYISNIIHRRRWAEID